MRSKALLVSLFALALTAACGKGPALDFPEKGGQDISTIPAGRYLATKVSSRTASSEGNVISIEHTFKIAGDPEEGDGFSVQGNWGRIASIYSNTNLPLEVTATGTAVEFKQKRYYTHSATSKKGWNWYISGGDDTDGLHFSDAFKSINKQSNATYTTTGIRTAALVNKDGTLSLYYEVKSYGTTQVVQITYTKK